MKEIFVGELQPDETVDAMREARMLSDVSLNFQFILIILGDTCMQEGTM